MNTVYEVIKNKKQITSNARVDVLLNHPFILSDHKHSHIRMQ